MSDETENEVSYEESKRAAEIFKKVKSTINRLDLESLELYTDVSDLREIESYLDDVDMSRIEEIPWEDIFNVCGPQKLWEVEEESESTEDKFYKVRYTVPDDEDKEEPEYTCTCLSYTFGNHSGEHCKHITKVKNRLRAQNREIPINADIIGRYEG
jgi:hypothetical protein